MRLTFLHGRGQGEHTAAALQSEWLAALAKGLKAAGLPPLRDDLNIQLPYYADVLDRLTAATKPKGRRARAKGSDPGTDRFAAAFILETAKRAKIDDSEIAAELGPEPIEKGLENKRWVLAAGRVLDRKVPGLGKKVLQRLTSDVDAYLNRPSVRVAVNQAVAPAVIGEPTVVVGHSLGSVVAYCLLIECEATTQVPLFVTVGSPLGMVTVKNCLPRPLRRPAGVAAWFNAADERDPVAMVARLDRDVFSDKIENVSDLHNPENNRHGIAGYLADPSVARHIAEALV